MGLEKPLWFLSILAAQLRAALSQVARKLLDRSRYIDGPMTPTVT
jgi:hypothetical protein